MLIYIAFNLLLASGTRSLLERLLSRRKVRELLVFVIFMLWMLPRFLFATGHRPHLTGSWIHLMENVAWPWTAAAWAALGRSELPALLSLAGWTLLAAWFGRTQFERNLRFDAVAAQATPQTNGVSPWQAAAEAFYRFPARLLRDPLAAIVEKELRSLARTPRYRMVFVMGFSFGLMVWLPMILGNRADRSSDVVPQFPDLVCVYALTLLGQVSFWNCFGFDRSAALIYFAAPQPLVPRRSPEKIVAALVFIYLEVFILVGVTTLFGVNPGAAQLLETLLVIGICSLYMLALGNISSVQYPRGLNPERVSQGGAASRFQALIMLLYPGVPAAGAAGVRGALRLRQRTRLLPGAGVRRRSRRNALLDCDGIGRLHCDQAPRAHHTRSLRQRRPCHEQLKLIFTTTSVERPSGLP